MFSDTLPIEKWNTRFGVSVRVVKRDPAGSPSGGRFVDNKSVKQIIKVQDKANGVKFVKSS
jgi:hypothetical protein